MKKILVIRYSSIGDIVLTSPVLRCLKSKFPGAAIHYATKEIYHPLLEANPHIDKIHLLGNSLSEHISDLKKENFDFVADLHNSLRSRRIRLALNVKTGSFSKKNLQKLMISGFLRSKKPVSHVALRYFEAVESLGVTYDTKGLDYFIPQNTQVPKQLRSIDLNGKYIVFVNGAKFATKRIPPVKALEIIEGIKLPVFLIGGKEDRARGEEIANKSKKTELANLCGELTLNESALLIKGAHRVICPDTGMMHIAAALGKKIISIWGSTSPLFGMYPFYSDSHDGKSLNKSVIIENSELNCRPCSKLGYDTCPQSHFNCMIGLPAQDIWELVNSQ